MGRTITPEAVERLIREEKGISIIDVREQTEFADGHIPGAINIPLNDIQLRMSEIDKAKEHIIVCLSGSRSRTAAAILSANGFRAKNMRGGMMNWNGPFEI